MQHAVMQQIKQSTISYIQNADEGDDKYKRKRKKMHGVWRMVHDR